MRMKKIAVSILFLISVLGIFVNWVFGSVDTGLLLAIFLMMVARMVE